jgi:hypothetical protein
VNEVLTVTWVWSPSFRRHNFYHSKIMCVLFFYLTHKCEKICKFFQRRVKDWTWWYWLLNKKMKNWMENPSLEMNMKIFFTIWAASDLLLDSLNGLVLSIRFLR